MGKIEDLRLFNEVVESGSISKAADRLGIAKSAVSRRLGLLEQRYSTTLIDRRPGNWTLTQSGRELLQRAQHIVGEMDEIENDFSETSQSASGPLSVSVPRDFGMGFLTDHLIAFRRDHPEIHLTVDFDDREVDLLRENYDFAVRITTHVLDAQTIQKIGSISLCLCASPEWIAQFGTPNGLDELAGYDLLNYGTGKRATWDFIDANGKPRSIDFQPRLNSNNGSFLRRATLDGAGIAKLPDFLVSKDLAEGKLVNILPDVTLPSSGIFLVRAAGRLLNRRMRLFAKSLEKLPC